MNIYFSIIILLLLIYSLLNKDWHSIFILIIFSLIGSLFYFEFFSIRILLIHLIATIIFLFSRKILLKKELYIFNGLFFEYLYLIILGIIYSFIIPWESISTVWSQQPAGKSLISLIRFMMEIFIIFFIAFFLWKKKITPIQILNILSFLILIDCIIALFDWYTKSYFFLKLLFDSKALGWDLLSTRILGFSNEPRIFGRLLVFGWFLIYYFNKIGYKIKFSKITLYIGFFTIIITFSLSSYLLLISLFTLSKYYDTNFTRKSIIYLFIIFLFLYIFVYFISNISNSADEINNTYWLIYKLQMITSGGIENKQIDGEPLFFTSFELFDRIALNHLYNSFSSFIFGSGPNLISIPASKYIDKTGQDIFGDSVNMIPGVGIINLISRSGLIGLLLFLYTFKNVKKYLIKNNLPDLLKLNYINFISFLIISTPFFYFINGFILGFILINSDKEC